MAGTKTRSSGQQFNPKGVTQGNTLVDPNTGQPIDVVTDVQGTRRLAVDANITAQVPEIKVELDYNEDSVQIGDPNTGSTLKINSDGSIDSNTEVDAGDGDNVGLKVQQRNNAPTDTQYNKRVTATTGTQDTDTTSMDVSLHDHQGNQFSQSNPFQITTNYEKIIQVILNSTWMKNAVYDQVLTTVSPDRQTITLDFKEDGLTIGKAFVNYLSDLNWNFTLERYLLEEDGTQWLDDDDVPLFLE